MVTVAVLVPEKVGEKVMVKVVEAPTPTLLEGTATMAKSPGLAPPKVTYGLASLCIGGGMGAAGVFEKL